MVKIEWIEQDCKGLNKKGIDIEKAFHCKIEQTKNIYNFFSHSSSILEFTLVHRVYLSRLMNTIEYIVLQKNL